MMKFSKKMGSIIFLLLAIFISLFLGNNYKFLIIKKEATLPNFIENYKNISIDENNDNSINTVSNINSISLTPISSTMSSSNDFSVNTQVSSPSSSYENKSNMGSPSSSSEKIDIATPVSVKDLSSEQVTNLLSQYLASKSVTPSASSPSIINNNNNNNMNENISTTPNQNVNLTF